MNYLSRDIRNEIADVLISSHNSWIRYRDKQPKHPDRIVIGARAIAEARIARHQYLVKLIAPKKCVRQKENVQ